MTERAIGDGYEHIDVIDCGSTTFVIPPRLGLVGEMINS